MTADVDAYAHQAHGAAIAWHGTSRACYCSTCRPDLDRSDLRDRLAHVARVLEADGYDGHAQTVREAIAVIR